MNKKCNCTNTFNKYVDVSKLPVDTWEDALTLLSLNSCGEVLRVEKPNYTDKGDGDKALFDDGEYKFVMTREEIEDLGAANKDDVDKALKEINEAIKLNETNLITHKNEQDLINKDIEKKVTANTNGLKELNEAIKLNETNLITHKNEQDLINKDMEKRVAANTNGLKELNLKDPDLFWEELLLVDTSEFPMGGLILTLNNTNKFTFNPGSNNSGDYKTSDGQEGKYEDGKYITINFDEVGDHQVILITNSYSGRTGIDNITANTLKDVKVVNGEYGPGSYKGTSGCKLSFFGDITSIGDSAFSGCSGFTGDLILPDSVTYIGDYTFIGCSGFTGDLIIPDGVTYIGDYAFKDCSGFTGELKIPDSVTRIGEGAFFGCSGFTGDLIIPESVTSIGGYAFYGCSGFTGDLIIPESVTSIRGNAFNKCSGLSKIYVCEDTELGSGWNADTTADVIKYKKGETPWLD